MYKYYDFNSIENLSLVMLWNYIYKSKFDSERYSAIKFKYYLKQNIHQIALLSSNLKSESQAVVNVLDSWQAAAAMACVIHGVNYT